MTIQRAIEELQNLLDADDIPLYYKPAIEKVKETIIDELPLADRPKGEWIESREQNILMAKRIEKGETWRVCSNCGTGYMIGAQYEGQKSYGERFHNFCPRCGADMRGEAVGVTSGIKDGCDVIMIPTDRLDEFVEKESRKRSNIAPTSSSEEFRGRLARSIKAAGRWLTDNAEGIAGSVAGRRSLDIHLSWERSGNEIAPTINIDSDFICLEAIAEMHRKEIEK